MKGAWQQLNERLIGSRDYFDLDAHAHAQFVAVGELAKRHARGRVLDAGAGRLAFRDVIAPWAKRYVSADLAAERPELDVVCDLAEPPFADAAFDTIFCLQVIEHTSRPGRVLRGLRRILADDGTLIVSAPHIAYLHGEPHDYFRYTKYGLVAMLEDAGFAVDSVRGVGGLLGFVGSLCSDVALTGLSRLPKVFPLAFAVNRVFVRAVCGLERRLSPDSMVNNLFAVDYAVVARKRLDVTAPLECASF